VRVDAITMICTAHQVQACIVCMTDDFHDWIWERKERRDRIKAERKAMTVYERYDLGGEA
jgi:hypothetical protein